MTSQNQKDELLAGLLEVMEGAFKIRHALGDDDYLALSHGLYAAIQCVTWKSETTDGAVQRIMTLVWRVVRHEEKKAKQTT